MNSVFPLIYSILLFFILFFISFYIIKQISNTQNSEKKIIRLQKNIQNKKSSYEDNYKLGQLYLKRNFFSKAILLFRQALETWDHNDKIGIGSLYNTLGFTYFNLKQYDFAIYYYKIAIHVLPDYILALKNLAYTYEKVSLYKDAYDFYQAVLVWDPNNELVLSRMLIVERKLSLKTY
uniref:hypothetical protein n=1 Tax=Microzonia abyssicola TaxID=217214 RepID=UPI002E778799|nr:hypothetical protein V2497_pgp101 [Syringoderma abyssicola]WAM64988.1 hypothetical protein [Syringoderma abyssicola]